MQSEADLPGDYAPDRRMYQAVLGTLFISVCVPTLLFWWRMGSTDMDRMTRYDAGFRERASRKWDLKGLAAMAVANTVLFAPGAIILSIYSVGRLRVMQGMTRGTHARFLMFASWRGALLAFINIPSLLTGAYLFDDRGAGTIPRFMLVFSIAGATGGIWNGWQVWREWYPECGVLPPFSLRTLLALLFAWGVVAGLFMPL